MICKKCGADNPDNATFCTECGKPMKRESYEMPSLDEPIQQYQKIEFPNQNTEDFTLPPAPVIQNPDGSPRFVGFKDAVRLYFKNVLNFRGRSTRSEYWYAFLFYVIVCFAATMFMSATGINVSYLIPIIFIVPNLSVLTRRMHDVGESGYKIIAYYVLYTVYDIQYYVSIKPALLKGESISTTSFFMPLALLIFGIYFLVKCCTMSEMKENKYGRKPH